MKKLEQLPTNIKRVVLMGPESTGKSTLAKALAKKFNTVYVDEYMRTYLEKKWLQESKLCEEKDIQAIVEGQIQLENELILKANEVVFCDTNALQNLIYAQEYYPNFRNMTVNYCIENHTYDLYLVCNIDIPWEYDILRDKPNEREKMFSLFTKELRKRNIEFFVLSGTLNQRLDVAKNIITKLINK